MMFNPPDLSQPGAYFDLRNRVTQSLQSAKVDERVFEAVQQLFEQTLNSEHIVLARNEKDRLLRQIVRSILTDMLAKMDHDR
jgi:hypothetical protein